VTTNRAPDACNEPIPRTTVGEDCESSPSGLSPHDPTKAGGPPSRDVGPQALRGVNLYKAEFQLVVGTLVAFCPAFVPEMSPKCPDRQIAGESVLEHAARDCATFRRLTHR